jgi:hypothetical protein
MKKIIRLTESDLTRIVSKVIKEQHHGKSIDKFITFQLEPHEEKTSNDPNSVFWVKDGEIIAEIDKRLSHLWLNEDIWNTISNMFSLEYNETQQVIKNWLEKHHNLVVKLTPSYRRNTYFMRWRNIELN